MQNCIDRHAALADSLGGRLAVWFRCLDTGETAATLAEEALPGLQTLTLPLVVALFGEVRKGRLNLAESCLVTNAPAAEGSGILKEMDPGLRLTYWDLATLMTARSDNVAANLLLDRVGLDAVNAVCSDLTMTKTVLRQKFLGRSSLPEIENTTCVGDLGLCLERMARGRACDPDADGDMITLLLKQHDKEGAAFYVPGARLAHKTGWQDAPPLALDAGLLWRGGGTWAYALACQGTESLVTARLLLATLMRDLVERIDQREGVSSR